MRHLFKNLIVALIVTSFVFTPEVIAKPVGIKAKDINKVYKVVKKNKKGVKLSSFVEANKPLLKRSVYKRITRDAFPFWDKKMSVAFGKDSVKISYKGKTLFAKYVDRGPVAFIVNKKPVLWKDVLTYGKAKARLEEIIRGKSSKKVSARDKFFGKMSSFAFAANTEDTCTKTKNRVWENGNCEGCNEGYERDLDPEGQPVTFDNNDNGACVLRVGDQKKCETKGRVWNSKTKECGGCDEDYPIKSLITTGSKTCYQNDEDAKKDVEKAVKKCDSGETKCVTIPDDDPSGQPLEPKVTIPAEDETTGETDADSKEKFDWKPLAIFGGIALFLIMLFKSKKKKRKKKNDDDDLPISGWTPEGRCPTEGARGLTSEDLPPGCSSCEDTNSCGSTESGSLDAGSETPVGY